MKRTALPLALLLTAAFAVHGGELRITGSNVFGETLGPRLVKSFTRTHPDVTVALRRPGTAEGLQALISGRADIAPASRPPTRGENRRAREAGTGIRMTPAASYVVRIITHESNPVKSLTAGQVRDIFSGRITNWKKVGGHDAPIHVFVLGSHTGARAGFREIAMDGRDYSASAMPLPGYEEIAFRVSVQAHGIGYTALGPLPERVAAVRVDGVAPSAASIRDRTYPFQRPITLCTLDGRESAEARRFLQFVSSTAGRRVVTRAGYAAP